MVNLKFLKGFRKYISLLNIIICFFFWKLDSKKSMENRPNFSGIWFSIFFWACKENLIILHCFHTINFKFKKWFTIHQKLNLTFCWVQFRVSNLNLSSVSKIWDFFLKFLAGKLGAPQISSQFGRFPDSKYQYQV